MTKNTVAHLTALLTVLIWGTTFIATKVLLRDFTPVEILFSRFTLGFLALSCLPGRIHFTTFRNELFFAGAGFSGVTLYFLFENIALQHTLVSNVGILVTAAPFFTAILSRFFGRKEPLHPNFFIGFLLALAGIALISFNGNVILELNPAGDILAILAALAWAVYSIFMKRIGELGHPMLPATRRVFLYGLLLMIPALFFMDFHPALRQMLLPVNLFNLAYLGLGASALCFATWNWTLKILGAVRVSIYIYLVPVIAVAAAMLILHETMTPMALTGIVLTLLGLFVSESGNTGFSVKRLCQRR